MTLFKDPTPRMEKPSRQEYAVVKTVLGTSDDDVTGKPVLVTFKGRDYKAAGIGLGIIPGDKGHFAEADGLFWFIKKGDYYTSLFKKPLKDWWKAAPATAAIRFLMRKNRKKYQYRAGKIVSVNGNNATILIGGEQASRTLPVAFEATPKILPAPEIGKSGLAYFPSSGPGQILYADISAYDNLMPMLDAADLTWPFPVWYDWPGYEYVTLRATPIDGKTLGAFTIRFFIYGVGSRTTYSNVDMTGVVVVPLQEEMVPSISFSLGTTPWTYTQKSSTVFGPVESRWVDDHTLVTTQVAMLEYEFTPPETSPQPMMPKLEGHAAVAVSAPYLPPFTGTAIVGYRQYYLRAQEGAGVAVPSDLYLRFLNNELNKSVRAEYF